MSVLLAVGVVTSRTMDAREYQREGRTQTMDVINVHLSDVNGIGSPLLIEVSKEQYYQFKLWSQYSVPVEGRAFSTRSGGAAMSYRLVKDCDVSKCVTGGSAPFAPSSAPASGSGSSSSSSSGK